MEDISNFSYNILPNRNDVAIIELGKSVLGGNDALNFTSKLMDISNKEIKHVIIDLTNVEIMNSSGLGMLVSGLSTLRKYDINLFLINIPSKVQGLLQMTHLDSIFKICNSIEDVIQII